MNDKIINFLENHPINIERNKKNLSYTNLILLRGISKYHNLISFNEKYNLKNPNSICPTAIIKGLSKNIGLKSNVPPETTGYYDSNLINKSKKCIELIDNTDCEFVFLHIKGVDDAGHDKDYEKKIEQLEKSYKMINHLVNNLKSNYILAITGDHSTPVLFGDHSYEKIPLIIYSNKLKLKEENCNNMEDIWNGKGNLDIINGNQLIPLLLDLKKELIK